MKPIWNPAPLASLNVMPANTRVQLLLQLLASCEERMQQIAAALEQEDCTAIVDAAHPMQSATGALGLEWLSAHSYELEHFARHDRLDDLRDEWSVGQKQRQQSIEKIRGLIAEARQEAAGNGE